MFLLAIVGCIPVLESPAGDDSGASGVFSCPENGWVRADPPSGLTGTGSSTGDTIPDFQMTDQHGDAVCLYQFYSHPVLLDISTMWCAPCRDIAGDVQATADAYKDQGLVYLTVLAQDLGTDPPDQDELNQWADYYGIVEPVLSDANAYYQQVMSEPYGFPGLFLLGPDMRILERDIIANDENIRNAIEGGI